MTVEGGGGPASEEVLGEIRSRARQQATAADLDGLVARVGGDRFVCIGEASHGTHEFSEWRCVLSRRLIEEHGFTWIGVEGDWPDCWRLNRWVRDADDVGSSSRQALDAFERLPTWM